MLLLSASRTRELKIVWIMFRVQICPLESDWRRPLVPHNLKFHEWRKILLLHVWDGATATFANHQSSGLFVLPVWHCSAFEPLADALPATIVLCRPLTIKTRKGYYDDADVSAMLWLQNFAV
eukprot:1142768-Pelagomonas_calceolata.AAC.5